MTDLEFDILDELYFLISFEELLKLITIDKLKLVEELKLMTEKGWINYFESIDGDHNPPIGDYINDFQKYYFLASKKGLISHNSR